MDTQKNNLYITLAIIVALIAIVITSGSDKEYILTDSSQENTISVTGESERFVVPDTASISFSMTRKSKDLSEATDSVNSRMKELLSSLKSDGVKESDIKTTGYNVNPQYVYTDRKQVFDGYRVTQSVQIKIKDLDNVNSVVTKIGEIQVDNVSGLSFFIDNDQEIQEELREEAIKDAKKKAAKLARDLGIDLDEISGFTEGGNRGYYPQPYFSKTALFAESADFAAEEATITAGENKMQSTVTITYTLN